MENIPRADTHVEPHCGICFAWLVPMPETGLNVFITTLQYTKVLGLKIRKFSGMPIFVYLYI